jgi:hypothetical protein
MALTKPNLVNANPGQPITAQAWNAVLSAIGNLYDAVLALGTNTVDIELRDGSTPVTAAQVVAVPASGAPVVAVPPRAGGTAFTLTGLSAGAWTVHVDAHGFTAAPVAVTIPASAAVTVNLTAATKLMPDLLALTGSAALTKLTADGIQIETILDVNGNEISKTNLPPAAVTARVLFQYPDPGDRVVAATAKTRLVLSSDVASQVTVVPSLVGMSYAQLLQAINDAGLKLGSVTYLTGK